MSQVRKVPQSEAEPWLTPLSLARELPYELAELASKAAALQASKALKQAETDKLRGWREWCSTHSRDGGAALFSYTRPAQPWAPSSLVQVQGVSRPATMAEEMDLLED
eukprot:2971490-Pyramimonas_sp.AAC.1